MVVEIEKGRLCEQQVPILVEIKTELEKQVSLMKEKEQVELGMYNECTNQLGINSSLLKVSNDQLKEANKPKWSQLLGSWGVGIVTGVLLIVLF